MQKHRLAIPIAALALVFGAWDAEAQRADRGNRGNQGQGGQQRSRPEGASRQGARQSQGQARPRATAPSTQPRGSQLGRANGAQRGGPAVAPGAQGGARGESQGYTRNGGSYARGGYGNGGNDNHGSGYRGGSGYNNGNGNKSYGYNNGYGGSKGGYYGGGHGRGGSYYRGGHAVPYNYRGGYGYSRYYYAPRPLPYYYAPRHYYGPGGHLSLYFGFGSGYLYGSVYTGRVYGYREPAPVYDSRRYYGDIRLQVTPRNASVYVDGYYAGIVDDFDGSSQRLALEVGPHKVEVAAEGGEAQVFDVYVDQEKTVELHADLRRYPR
jgi:hypothetical protein